MVQVQTRGAGSAEGVLSIVLAQFLDVSRKFTATLEDMRKQELMQSRGINSRKSLAFDDLRPNFPRSTAAIYAPAQGARHGCSVS
jgi:hypothetical protein